MILPIVAGGYAPADAGSTTSATIVERMSAQATLASASNVFMVRLACEGRRPPAAGALGTSTWARAIVADAQRMLQLTRLWVPCAAGMSSTARP